MDDPEGWIGTTLVALIGVIFAAGVALSLVLTTIRIHFTRQRPIGLCRRCGYSLTGNLSGVCPECGTRVGNVGSGSV
jgi:hypothetical protein